MKFLGLNSPVIFLISVIILTILGPKRIEKGWLLFQRLLKFLLGKEEIIESKSEDAEVTEVKEEVIESKSEDPEVTEVKEEVIESKSEDPVVTEVKEEVIESKSEDPKKSKAKK